jgi:hypothetical protein
MHWYVAVVAAAGYTFMAWAGPAIIAATAGGQVAGLCEIPLSSYCILGIFYAINIIPVISALALSDAKPGFVISLFSNSAQLIALVLLAHNLGVPPAYYAPLFAIPFLVAALGTSSSRLLDDELAWQRIRPVLVPAAYGLAGVAASLLVPTTVTLLQRAAVGAVLAPCVLALIIASEHRLGINAEPHRQLARVARHALGLAGGVFRALFPGRIEKGLPEEGGKAV